MSQFADRPLSPDRLVWHLSEGTMAKAVLVGDQTAQFTASGNALALVLARLK